VKSFDKGLKKVEESLFLSLNNKGDSAAFSRHFLSLLAKNLPYPKGALKLILNSQRELTLENSFGFSVDYPFWNSKVGEQRLNEKVMIIGKYEVIPDLHVHPQTKPFREIYTREGVRAFLVMPIQSPRKNIGVLNLYHSEPGFFPEDLIAPLQRLLQKFGTLSSLLWMRDEESHRREIFQQKCDELQNLRSFYELIIENIPVGVVATNKSGYVLLMNQVMEKMSGQKKENVLGRKWYEAFGFSGETRKRLENSYWTGKVNYFPEIPISLVDGKVIPSEMMTASIKNDKREVVGVVAICSDLTEKKRIEKEIERIERLSKLGQVATGVAHEIRNPLAGINNVLQLLKGKLAEDEEAQYLLQKTFGQITRLNHFLENLLSFTSGRKLTFEKARIDELCEDVLLFVKKPLATNHITLIKKYGKGLPTIYIDKPSITQVLFNILLNAIKAMPRGGKILLETSLVDDLSKMANGIFWNGDDSTSSLREKTDCPYVCISVKDEGIGISSSEINKIFEPFYSASEGVGLGLYISGKIVENHQGLLGVESESKKGATFYLLLPTVH
jgi:PAS domain S-box-containing protein